MKPQRNINLNFFDYAFKPNWWNGGYCEPSELAIKITKDRLRDRLGRENNMKWKYKVGDIIKESNGNQYEVMGIDYDAERYELVEYDHPFTISKEACEMVTENIKPKSLFEQALELVNLKLHQEFEFDFGGYKGSGIYRFDEDGQLWRRINEGWLQGWETSNAHLDDILTSGKLPKIHKPKSEAELILEELAKVVDKAEDILRRSGK